MKTDAENTLMASPLSTGPNISATTPPQFVRGEEAKAPARKLCEAKNQILDF